MSIDNPIKAAEALVASDERQASPITELAVRLAEAIRIKPADKIAAYLGQRRAENREYMFNVLKVELEKAIERLDRLSVEQRRFLETEYFDLVADGLRKSENLRDRKRILHIAIILANAAYSEPSTTADDVEEMMRIAMDLADSDVAVLRSLEVRADNPIERISPPGRSAPLPFGTYRGPSSEIPIEVPGLSPELIQSCCLKLQSFGLAVVDAETKWGEHRAFRLLPKGRQFIRYIEELASS